MYGESARQGDERGKKMFVGHIDVKVIPTVAMEKWHSINGVTTTFNGTSITVRGFQHIGFTSKL